MRVEQEIPGSDEAVSYLKGQGFHVWWAGLDRVGCSYWAVSNMDSNDPSNEYKLYNSAEITDLARIDILKADASEEDE